MQFPKFEEFLKKRETNEWTNSPTNNRLNRPALDYEKKLTQFNSRFSDPKEGSDVIHRAGYKSVGEFIADPDERKWSKLKIPGQQNYIR